MSDVLYCFHACGRNPELHDVGEMDIEGFYCIHTCGLVFPWKLVVLAEDA